MCTSITLKTEDGLNLLSRTMDFPFVLDSDLIMVPRNYEMALKFMNNTTKYAFAGQGKNIDEYIFADGINEKGLACASLYFPGYATYEDKENSTMINLGSYEVVNYLLANCATVAEVKVMMSSINIVSVHLDFLQTIVPLHWIVSDSSGETIVIEPMKEGIVIHDNPLGVMTNSPDFNWHLTNVRNYIGLSYNQLKPLTLEGITFEPFGQGTGGIGLPGDYTPPSRFIRALFGKQTISEVTNEETGINAVFHILSSVDIPKGSVHTQEGPDYTQYTSSMVTNTCSYYFKTYENNQIAQFKLLEENLDAKEVKILSLSNKQVFTKLNT